MSNQKLIPVSLAYWRDSFSDSATDAATSTPLSGYIEIELLVPAGATVGNVIEAAQIAGNPCLTPLLAVQTQNENPTSRVHKNEIIQTSNDDQSIITNQAPIANRIGIFGVFKKTDDVVFPFDRIEIYAPLRIDPKESRLQRIEKKRRQKIKD